MFEWDSDPPLHVYAVVLGHARVVVHTPSAREAIPAARRAFCRDMPRMWDVIQHVADSRFLVQEITGLIASPTDR